MKMEENEKIKFDFDDFDKEWNECLTDVDEDIKAKISDEDREFARGFYYALSQLDIMIENVIDDVTDDDSNKLLEIKKEILETAGERLKEYMGGEFEETITWLIEKY